MATLTYTFVERCGGGGHTTFDVSLNAGPANRVVYDTDELREPLSSLRPDEREMLSMLILKIHFTGMTRDEIITELNQGPVTVTI